MQGGNEKHKDKDSITWWRIYGHLINPQYMADGESSSLSTSKARIWHTMVRWLDCLAGRDLGLFVQVVWAVFAHPDMMNVGEMK